MTIPAAADCGVQGLHNLAEPAERPKFSLSSALVLTHPVMAVAVLCRLVSCRLGSIPFHSIASCVVCRVSCVLRLVSCVLCLVCRTRKREKGNGSLSRSSDLRFLCQASRPAASLERYDASQHIYIYMIRNGTDYVV